MHKLVILALGLGLAVLCMGAGLFAAKASGAGAAHHAATLNAVQAPAPSYVSGSIETELPCCVPLGGLMQLRYSAKPVDGFFEFALLGSLSAGSWMAFGPADPTATNRLMVRLLGGGVMLLGDML